MTGELAAAEAGGDAAEGPISEPTAAEGLVSEPTNAAEGLVSEPATDGAPAAGSTPEATLAARRAAALRECRRSVQGHGRSSPAAKLAALGAIDLGDEAADPDMYGVGGVVTALELEVAELLGKPAAVFMPSGVMAQQCALRVWTDRQGSKRVALHAMSHLVLHELAALELLHGLQLDLLSTEPVPPTAADLAQLPGRLGAVTIELPLRDGGHRLPTWDELVAFSTACRDRGVPLHLDGARLWESAPYWGRTPADVAALADSVYVSFYKSLGALAGAALAGPQDVVDEARRWQRRHGGTLYTLLPYAAAAREGLRAHAGRMTEYHAAAGELAAALMAAGLQVQPDPPHTNAFVVYAPRPADEVNERLLAHLEEQHEHLISWFRPAEIPDWSWTEFMVGAATCDAGVETVAASIARVVLGSD